MKKPIGIMLIELRGELTQEEFATKIKESRSSIANWEVGRSKPRPKKRRNIEIALNLPKGTLARQINTPDAFSAEAEFDAVYQQFTEPLIKAAFNALAGGIAKVERELPADHEGIKSMKFSWECLRRALGVDL